MAIKEAAYLEIPIGKRTKKYRFFEMLPGLLSWSMLLVPIVLSIVDPTSRLAAVFILFFMMSWFYRAVGMAYRTVQGYRRMKQSESINWLSWLNHLSSPQEAIKDLQRKRKLSIEDKIHLENLESFTSDSELSDMLPDDIIQFVIVPMWKESYEVVQPTIQSLLDSRYNPKQIVLTIAYEARGGKEPKKTALRLQKEYAKKFRAVTITEHPDGLKDEVVGKGGNVTWAAREMLPYFEKNNIESRHVMVTTLDADNHVHRDYFAHLTYAYILTKDRKHRSYQPLALYTNNIWDVPAPMRVLAVGNSFFTITQSVRPHLSLTESRRPYRNRFLEYTNNCGRRASVLAQLFCF
jgi:hypothetical protein